MSDYVNDTNKPGCWNVIGVWGGGDDRCPTLKVVTHCYNCDVFHQSSQKVFEKLIDKAYRNEWTNLLSEEKRDYVTENNSSLIFRVGKEWFALPSVNIKEITRLRGVQRIPHNKNIFMAGIMNVSGDIEPCFSLEKLFGISKLVSGGESDNKVIVTTFNDNSYVFVVSEVGDVIRYSSSNLVDLPDTLQNYPSAYISSILRWNGKDVGIIDPDFMYSVIDRSLR